MSAISREEFTLVIVGLAYLLVTAVYVLWLSRSGESLLRAVKRDETDEVWQALGAPSSLRGAVQDPQHRWRKFIRTKSYQHRCSPLTAARIDAFRIHSAISGWSFSPRPALPSPIVSGGCWNPFFCPAESVHTRPRPRILGQQAPAGAESGAVSALHANKRFELCHRSRKTGLLRGIDDLAHILVGTWRFLGNAAH